MRFPDCYPNDGVQIGDGSSEKLEEVDGFLDHSHGFVREEICGWDSGRGCCIGFFPEDVLFLIHNN
jgi:hypothetical protein